MTALLSVAGVSRAFGGVYAVRDVDLDVAPGETHAVIGPNGAGKSTLFSLIGGHLRPNAGDIRYDGESVLEVPAYRVAPVDTTGAGDSFNAGFLHRWLQEAPLADCLRLGAACGALSTRSLGGTAAQPTLAEAEALVRSGA